MNAYMKIIPLLIFLFLFSACKHDDKSSTYIKVYKSDSSIQCENNGIDLAVMELELINAGIDVVCSQKGHDGFSRSTVCGADTGNINIYTLNRVNLPDAESIGFENVSALSEYQDQICE